MSTFSDLALFVYNISTNCSAYSYPFLLSNETTNCSSSLQESESPDDHPMFEGGGFFGPPPLIVEMAKVLYGLVGLIGLCGNTLVIYVVLRFSKMHTVTNMYILNLALADEMYLSGLPFLLTTMVYASWPFGRVMCKVYMTTTSINQFTSSLLLTVMSADRYVAVCHPVQSPRYRTAFVAKFVCLTAWTLSALLMVPIYMYASILRTGPYISCNIYWPENAYMNGEMAFTLYAFTLGFALPLALILVFYFLVVCRLRRVGPRGSAFGQKTSEKRRKTHRKVTYLVLTVVTVYVICWLPYWCAQLWLTFMPPEDAEQNNLSFAMMLLTGCLSYANSAVNPVLYAFLSDNFKRSFAKAFTCAKRREINAQLHVENSVFPNKKKLGSSSKQRAGTTQETTFQESNKKCLEMMEEPSTAVTITKNDKEATTKNGIGEKQRTQTEVTQV